MEFKILGTPYAKNAQGDRVYFVDFMRGIAKDKEIEVVSYFAGDKSYQMKNKIFIKNPFIKTYKAGDDFNPSLTIIEGESMTEREVNSFKNSQLRVSLERKERTQQWDFEYLEREDELKESLEAERRKQEYIAHRLLANRNRKKLKRVSIR